MAKRHFKVDGWDLESNMEDMVVIFHNKKFAILQSDAETEGSLLSAMEIVDLGIDGITKSEVWVHFKDPKDFNGIITELQGRLEKLKIA